MSDIFLINKYTTWYYNIVYNRQLNPTQEVLMERHHIIPKSLGGGNESTNIVTLTLREHILVHRLLAKMTTGKHRRSMNMALFRMMHGRQQALLHLSPMEQLAAIEAAREGCRERMTGRVVSEATRRKISEIHTGLTHSDATKQLISQRKMGVPAPKPEGFGETVSAALKGKQKTADHVNKINRNPVKIEKTRQKHLGSTRSQQSKQKMSEKRKQILSAAGGALNKGMRHFYDPITNESRLFNPGTQPVGWISGNPAARGKKKYHNSITRQVKRFIPGTEPSGWIIGLPK